MNTALAQFVKCCGLCTKGSALLDLVQYLSLCVWLCVVPFICGVVDLKGTAVPAVISSYIITGPRATVVPNV